MLLVVVLVAASGSWSRRAWSSLAGAWRWAAALAPSTAARLAETTAGRMVEVCDLLAAELSAGRPTEAALDEAAAAWSAIRPVADACRLGGDVPAALREASHGRREPTDYDSWPVPGRCPTAPAAGCGAATRRVADAVRRDQATRRVVAGELASARATARLVAGLPVVALLMGSGAGARPLVVPVRHAARARPASPPVWPSGFVGLWWIELIAREVDR